MWSSASLARAGESALRKLAAAGVETGQPPPDLDARLDATEPAFAPLLAAAVTRTEVSFDYRAAGAPAATPRRVQPWGLASWHGRWYVAGRDLDRADSRVFKLSRVSGDIRRTSEPGAFERPVVNLAALVADSVPVAPVAEARLWVADGAAHALRRDASSRVPAAHPSGAPAGEEIRVPFADVDHFADRVVGHGPDVVVLAPPQLRDAVVARLASVLG
jgi:proteasome accessory factor B